MKNGQQDLYTELRNTEIHVEQVESTEDEDVVEPTDGLSSQDMVGIKATLVLQQLHHL